MFPFIAGSSVRASAVCPLRQRCGWERPQSHQYGRELGHGKGRDSLGGGRRYLRLRFCKASVEWSLVWDRVPAVVPLKRGCT